MFDPYPSLPPVPLILRLRSGQIFKLNKIGLGEETDGRHCYRIWNMWSGHESRESDRTFSRYPIKLPFNIWMRAPHVVVDGSIEGNC